MAPVLAHLRSTRCTTLQSGSYRSRRCIVNTRAPRRIGQLLLPRLGPMDAKERQLSEIFSLPKNFASIVRNYNSITKRIEVYDQNTQKWHSSYIYATGGNFLYIISMALLFYSSSFPWLINCWFFMSWLPLCNFN